MWHEEAVAISEDKDMTTTPVTERAPEVGELITMLRKACQCVFGVHGERWKCLYCYAADDITRLSSELERERRRADKAEKANERAFSTLDAYGVPAQRGRNVANGIMVMMTRMDREYDALQSRLDAIVAMARKNRVLGQSAEAQLHALILDGPGPC